MLDILSNANTVDYSSSSPTSAASHVRNAIVSFLLKFDPRQVRYVGSTLLKLLELVGSGKLFSVCKPQGRRNTGDDVLTPTQPTVTIELLAGTILRIDPTGSMYTSTHLLLAKLAYESACAEPALRVIDRDILYYPGIPNTKATGPLFDATLPPTAYISTETGLTRDVTSTSVLEYNLVSGLIYMSRRNWPKARKALERAVTHPAKYKGVSKIMVEAYKKWLLVGLLENGQEPTLPHYTAHSAKATYANLAGPYANIASLFSSEEAASLLAEAQSNTAVWTEDGNGALVSEVLAVYQRWKIINLRRVYSKIPVSQIQASTSSAETGQHLNSEEEVTALIRAMIADNMLRGELHMGEDGVQYLAFHSDQTLSTEQDFAREIAQAQRTMSSLTRDYKLANNRLSGNKEYIKHVAREQKRLDKESEHPSGNFEMQIEDEDLMTGIIANG